MKIIRISGPLVVIDDKLNLYEIVRVGEEKLVGEVIKVEGNKSYAQIYEDTTGLRVGEPVERTNQMLSVELGPGLLANIFDGIGRPLEKIYEKLDSPFIKRGIVVNTLDREKKWEFKPIAEEGKEVKPGQVLGVVEETPSVKHKILVPPNVSGKLEEIKEGKFSVDEPIAVIGGQEIQMLQVWPVRKSRPYKEKLDFNYPFITGTRVLDIMFPIAKGGSAAIPGPFGSGKCVDGETVVLTKEFGLIKIKDLYNLLDGKGKKAINSEVEEEWTELDKPITVYSYKDGRIVETKATHIYKGKTRAMVFIKTRSGREIKVTPIHKLFKGKITKDGLKIEEVEAYKLKVGDKILVAKKVDNEESGYVKLDIRMDQTENRGKAKKIKVPEFLDEKLAELLGYIIADGSIKTKSVAIYNNDLELLRRANELFKELFGIEGKIKWGRTVYALQVNSVNLVKFFEQLNLKPGKKADKWVVPRELLISKESVIEAFLKAYIRCDGHIHKKKGQIEIVTASYLGAISLAYLFSRLGIFTVWKEKEVKGKKYYRLFVTGGHNLKKLGIDLGRKPYTSYEIVEIDKELLRIKRRVEYENAGVEISNYLTNGENMSIFTFKKLAHLLGLEEVANNHLKHLMFDIITEIKIVEKEQEVYDITTETHNFVGGNMPTLLHNTVTNQQIAKWSDANIVIYIGCGERGNEMTEVLEEFPKLEDPKTGKKLIYRTILIANTSNMPVAAREASVYIGATIGEYFRDQGYSVVLNADSTSRWAEAMREIAGRLGEIPSEEGYPAYLQRRIAEFYERSGRVVTLGGEEGALTIIGAVSPPGGDFSEPVTQNTLRFVGAFWALDAKLAYRRHYPAINYLISYTKHWDYVKEFFEKNYGEDIIKIREEFFRILKKEADLQDIVSVVGPDALAEKDRLILHIGRIIREGFLQQDAFDPIDTYSPLEKSIKLMRIIYYYYQWALRKLKEGKTVKELESLGIWSEIIKLRFVLLEELDEKIKEIRGKLKE